MVGFSHISQKRRGLAKGQRVEVNEFFYRVYPFSRARTGTVLGLSRGTQIIVQFDQLKAKMSLDERCVETADGNQRVRREVDRRVDKDHNKVLLHSE